MKREYWVVKEKGDDLSGGTYLQLAPTEDQAWEVFLHRKDSAPHLNLRTYSTDRHKIESYEENGWENVRVIVSVQEPKHGE